MVRRFRSSCLALSTVYLPPRCAEICGRREAYAWAKSRAVTTSPLTFAAQVSGVGVRYPDEPRPNEKMKVTMIAPKMSTIKDERALDRITSSMWGTLLQAPEMRAKMLYERPLESLTG